MPLFQVVILAIVQGITEFLPISSSAHLTILPWLLGWKDPGLEFDIALHVGTLIAVLGYFFKDWIQIVIEGFGGNYGAGRVGDPELRPNRMLLWMIALGSIPAGIAGLVFREQAETIWRSPSIIGAMLIAIGLIMWAAERAGAKARNLSHLNFVDAGLIGLSQALAIVPGTSRSGVTIATGLFRQFDRVAAARFSFLLSTPVIAGAALSALLHMRKHGGIAPDMRVPFIVGIVVSAAVGAAVIALFMRFMQNRTLYPFIYYRIAFGIIVLALAAFR
ncbi:MAG: undecaprenyl-diphosphate phosphatase [Bryobacteraceae bacterium]